MQKKILIFFILFFTSLNGWSQETENFSQLPNFSSLAEEVMPAVVNVSVTKVIKSTTQNDPRRGPFNDPFFDEFFGRFFRRRKLATKSGVQKPIQKPIQLFVLYFRY